MKPKENRNRNSGPKFALIALPSGPDQLGVPETGSLLQLPELITPDQEGAVLQRLDQDGAVLQRLDQQGGKRVVRL